MPPMYILAVRSIDGVADAIAAVVDGALDVEVPAGALATPHAAIYLTLKAFCGKAGQLRRALPSSRSARCGSSLRR